MNWNTFNWLLLTPEIVILTTAVFIILTDLFISDKEDKSILSWIEFIGLVTAFYTTFRLYPGELFGNLFVIDNIAIFAKQLLIGITALVVLASIDYVKQLPAHQGEYYFLLLFATLGMLFMASASELITIFISLEFASLCCIILSAYLKRDPKSSEAGLKYFLIGVLSSAILLYGMSFIYGLTGTTFLSGIGYKVLCGVDQPEALILAIILLIAGFSFKISAVPFHMWAPDTYEGAPTPVTTYLATASKIAGFVIIIRIFMEAFIGIKTEWVMIMAVLSALSMGIGNLCAVPQTNIKRMLAYSSIGHAGYMLIGLSVVTWMSISSIMLYLLVYSLASLGVFLVVIAFSNQTGSDEIESYAGLHKRAPFLALSMLLCLVSMAGIPPLAGFIGKFYLFAGAIKQGVIWLPAVGVLFSVVSVYYYFGIVKAMYFKAPIDESKIASSFPLNMALFISVIGIIIIGIYPSPFLKIATSAIKMFF